MRVAFSVLFFLGFLSSIIAQNELNTSFDTLLQRAQLNFVLPKGLQEIEVEYFHKMPHQKAIGPADSSYQIRFWIDPLDKLAADYYQKTKQEKESSLHPNLMCKSMMMIAVLNVTNNKSRNYETPKDFKLTKKAYNADWEAASLVELGWPSLEFEYCYVWCLHKDDVADVYVYVLTHQKEDMFEVIKKVSGILKFK